MSVRGSDAGRDHLWSIVLAGGDGRRLQPFVQRWLGRARPKQYCVFVGTRSMLQHTVDRADRLTAPHRKITVIGRAHQADAWDHFQGRRAGVVLVQPANRDTAAGLFLPLSYVRAVDPHAVVVVYPSDHFVYPEERFMEAVGQAVDALDALEDRVVLLGARPDRMEGEYGWVLPDGDLEPTPGSPIRTVSRFLEKPGLLEMREARRAGGLWNTLVVVARAQTLWMLGWRAVPEVVRLFDRFEGRIGSDQEAGILASVYRDMPSRNFSSEVLQYLPSHLAVLELTGVLWSDWGRAERILDSLRRIGKVPAFPAHLLTTHGARGPMGGDPGRMHGASRIRKTV